MLFITILEQHRKSLQKYHEQLRRETEDKKTEVETSNDEMKRPMTDQELWSRLEQLELQEQQEKEMEQEMYVNKGLTVM